MEKLSLFIYLFYFYFVYFQMSGEHDVPMIHSAVLVNLQYSASDYLTFDDKKLSEIHEFNENLNYYGPVDDIIVFAISANFSGSKMYVSNSQNYGYILVPLDEGETLSKDETQIVNTKVFIIHNFNDVKVNEELQQFVKYPSM